MKKSTATKGISKVFVLDTNVILHDHSCIRNFQDNDVVLPITVLEELDKFKKGNEEVNYNAREFSRELDKISGDSLFNGGIALGKNMGKLRVELGQKMPERVQQSLYDDIPDNRILSIALHVKEQHPDRPVILISKDINLRLKAKAFGLLAQDYLTDKVADIDTLKKDVEEVPLGDDLIETFYKNNELPANKLKQTFSHNEYLILRGNSKSALAYFDKPSGMFKRIEKHRAYGIEPRNSEQAFSLDALLRKDVQLVALTGKAGTGKTLLALAAALAQEKEYDQILVARPIVPLSNKDIGFLPGDVESKIGPYMLPLYDNINFIKTRFKNTNREYMRIEEILKSDKLVITPLAYIRGRSLTNVYFIIDEAQNLTPHEIKTIITRAGEGTKLVFTGDIFQIDQPYLDIRSNGLTYLSDKMLGQELFAHVNLVKGERSMLAELASNLL
ncbi:PhoH family protein [uncultured Acetobacteroides sp.]|uniref:PhoH family protein n=1 Tax=uncultured Acetobacteroides sp. TaxID=1760811 RepID=UPI0029F49737|nr:PhoH family protein [uncultured Acetobacteroides sp.]